MVDLFAFLLKTRFLAKGKFVEEVIAGLSPVLSQLAAAKHMSEGQLVAYLLCAGLDSLKEDVIPLLKGVDNGTHTKMKGIDKVSDDCLKKALEYLPFDDRLNAVELSCHRLLQLSRAAPIHCQKFGGSQYKKRKVSKKMVDLFAFLLKTRFLAKEKSVEEVIAGLSPVLSQLAAVKHMSEGLVVAYLLCAGLDSLKEDVILLKLKGVDDSGTHTKMKGIDKVSDDCLKKALEFLPLGDRLNAVELSCHRLLQLSRAVPFHCQKFDRHLFKRQKFELKVAQRFRIEVLDLWLCHNQKWLAAYFRESVVDLRNAECRDVLALTFPRLKRVAFMCGLNGASQFLGRHPHIEKCGVSGVPSTNWEQHGDEFFTQLAKSKTIRCFDLSVSGDFPNLVAPNVDLSHITEVKWSGDYEADNEACHWPWLFHDNVQSLTVERCWDCFNGSSAVFSQMGRRSLRHLQLGPFCDMRVWKAKAFRGLRLQSCRIVGDSYYFFEALSKFAASTLELVLVCEGDYNGCDTNKKDFKVNANIQQLIVAFKDEESVVQHFELVQWLARNVHRFVVPITVRMPPNWEQTVDESIGEFFREWDGDGHIDESEESRRLYPERAAFRSHLGALQRRVTVVDY